MPSLLIEQEEEVGEGKTKETTASNFFNLMRPTPFFKSFLQKFTLHRITCMI